MHAWTKRQKLSGTKRAAGGGIHMGFALWGARPRFIKLAGDGIEME
jgi:hypothetical protein